MIQITYQKNNGCIFQRFRETPLPYKIGEITSMGWKVLNIEYEYKNKYYSENDYNNIILKNKQNRVKIKHNKEQYTEEFKKILYYFIAALIINYLRTIFNI